LRWVFGAMNVGFRRMFAPCFLYFELRNLQMILRALAARNQVEFSRLSGQSLLPQKLRLMLQQSGGFDDALAHLDAWLIPVIGGWQPLAATYRAGSTRAVEQQLVDGLLLAMATGSLRTELTGFVAELIDLRNLLTVARYLRWDLAEPPLLAGGSAISRQLKTAYAARGMDGLQGVLQRQAVDAGADVALFESELLARIGRRLAHAGRDPLGPAMVLDYLWRRYQLFRSAGLEAWAGDELAAWEQLG